MTSPAGSFKSIRTTAIAAIVMLLLAWTGMLERSDRWWFDALQNATAMRAATPDNTALVLIDEQSLAAMGEAPFGMRWPWPRTAFAALLTGLHAAGAKVVVVDLIFFESSAAAEQDLLLAAVAAGIPEVKLAALPDRLPIIWPEPFRQQHGALFTDEVKWGFVASEPDEDGVIRNYRAAGSLAAAAQTDGQHVTSADDPRLLRWRGNLEQIRSRDVPILPAAPFVAAGWSLLDTATQASPDLEPASLVAAIETAAPPMGEVFEKVRGRTVFVGANAAATFDAIATPLGAPEPGVVLHWNAFANLEANDFISGLHPATSWVAGLLVILAILLAASNRAVAAGGASPGLTRPALVAVIALLLILASSVGLFLWNYWLAPALPLIAAGIGFTAVAVESFRLEHARKQEIQGWFGAYVSPAVVDRLVADPGAIELGGEQRELTILFSDIAGFTTISERLPPPQLVQLINRFLETQAERILDSGGYVDKFIGDAVMAVFGSPEELDNHALSACRATLACHAALEKFNDAVEAEFGMRLGMRTGINSGDVVVGNVGSSRKRNYTVLGDAVNLASRLEGANKETGTSILLGPLTAERVAGHMLLRPVARLQVKGKTQAVEVSELLAERSGADPALVAFADEFTRGFRAFCARDFETAIEVFRHLTLNRPDDVLVAHYLLEAGQLQLNPPPSDWQGVLKLETK